MSRSRVIETLPQTVFVIAPPRDSVFTAEAVEGLRGRTTLVQRLDGSEAQAEIVHARLCPDGNAAVTVAVPGGIDRAPKEEVA